MDKQREKLFEQVYEFSDNEILKKINTYLNLNTRDEINEIIGHWRDKDLKDFVEYLKEEKPEEKRTIKIIVQGGLVEDVQGLKDNECYEIIDKDVIGEDKRLKYHIEQEDDIVECLECEKEFNLQTDIILCDDCMKLFDTDKLWKLHDDNKLCAIDFNESKKMMEEFRLK